ncbi:hypothetical protein [Azohydromonas australica]|uniref:hypothetical protein n=1 Tax=Azohydromonas australica TaxID=364039 RepID=UPI00040E7E3D|nr:hypothetical protein [Azohydromonas australica]
MLAALLASFARTTPFRALQTQLKRSKGPVTDAELRANDRLRFAFVQHVLSTLKKAARSERAEGGPQTRLFES